MLAAQWAQLPQEKKQVSLLLHGVNRELGLAVCSLVEGLLPPGHLFIQEPEGMFQKAGMQCLPPHPLKAITGL